MVPLLPQSARDETHAKIAPPILSTVVLCHSLGPPLDGPLSSQKPASIGRKSCPLSSQKSTNIGRKSRIQQIPTLNLAIDVPRRQRQHALVRVSRPPCLCWSQIVPRAGSPIAGGAKKTPFGDKRTNRATRQRSLQKSPSPYTTVPAVAFRRVAALPPTPAAIERQRADSFFASIAPRCPRPAADSPRALRRRSRRDRRLRSAARIAAARPPPARSLARYDPAARRGATPPARQKLAPAQLGSKAADGAPRRRRRQRRRPLSRRRRPEESPAARRVPRDTSETRPRRARAGRSAIPVRLFPCSAVAAASCRACRLPAALETVFMPRSGGARRGNLHSPLPLPPSRRPAGTPLPK
jgi:hypothetical protein